MPPRCCWPEGGSPAGIGCTIGAGLVEAVELALEFRDEAVPLLFEPFEPLELLELVLFLRAQGGRSVCCCGGGGVGPGWSCALVPRTANTPEEQASRKKKAKKRSR